MDDFVSESDSDYTSYWRDWVSEYAMQPSQLPRGANWQLHPRPGKMQLNYAFSIIHHCATVHFVSTYFLRPTPEPFFSSRLVFPTSSLPF